MFASECFAGVGTRPHVIIKNMNSNSSLFSSQHSVVLYACECSCMDPLTSFSHKWIMDYGNLADAHIIGISSSSVPNKNTHTCADSSLPLL